MDAITWCLWGKARSKTPDELISYGADECRVELDFRARDIDYRAIRVRARGGGRRRQGMSDLQLQVLGESGPQSITGNHLRNTQTKIDQVVGMDYDTFINSAFLLQGRADEFTNKSPAERKAVLSKILGLEEYDRLQDVAKERFDECKSAAMKQEGVLGEVRRQAEDIGDLTQDLADNNRALEDASNHVAENSRLLNDLQRQVTELAHRRDRIADSDKRMKNAHLEVEQLKLTLALGYSRVQQYRLLLDQADAINDGATRLQHARRRFEGQEEARRRFDELTHQKSILSQAINLAQGRLEVQVDHLRQQVEVELPSRVNAWGGLMQDMDGVRIALERIAKEERTVADQRSHKQSLATMIGESQTTAERYRLEGLEVKSKLELLSQTGSNGNAAVCPLCQTPLEEDGCQRLTETYEQDIQAKRDLYRQNDERLKTLRAELSHLDKELPRREQDLAQARRDQELKAQELTRGIEDSRAASEDLKRARIELDEAVKSLQAGEFAPSERDQLQDLETQIGTLCYDEQGRRSLYAEILDLEAFDEQRSQLADAETNLPRELESVAQAEIMSRSRQSEVTELEQLIQVDQEAALLLPDWEYKLLVAKETQGDLERKHQEVLSRRVYLELQLDQLEGLRRRLAAGSLRLVKLQEDQATYQELVTAFGRQGVQAMLIETVVPRLEEEANSLLGRMTDYRMHVKLETQRERRTGLGEPIETLEIKVYDELGPRSYEMYSGGEAFRVNLALRIALSKVLAQRTGTPLPTLFIDEGFGTQDAAGRERILDVISAIQDDFEKIIVITHLDDMKDVFPVRIEVQKGEGGSTFWLS